MKLMSQIRIPQARSPRPAGILAALLVGAFALAAPPRTRARRPTTRP